LTTWFLFKSYKKNIVFSIRPIINNRFIYKNFSFSLCLSDPDFGQKINTGTGYCLFLCTKKRKIRVKSAPSLLFGAERFYADLY